MTTFEGPPSVCSDRSDDPSKSIDSNDPIHITPNGKLRDISLAELRPAYEKRAKWAVSEFRIRILYLVLKKHRDIWRENIDNAWAGEPMEIFPDWLETALQHHSDLTDSSELTDYQHEARRRADIEDLETKELIEQAWAESSEQAELRHQKSMYEDNVGIYMVRSAEEARIGILNERRPADSQLTVPFTAAAMAVQNMQNKIGEEEWKRVSEDGNQRTDARMDEERERIYGNSVDQQEPEMSESAYEELVLAELMEVNIKSERQKKAREKQFQERALRQAHGPSAALIRAQQRGYLEGYNQYQARLEDSSPRRRFLFFPRGLEADGADVDQFLIPAPYDENSEDDKDGFCIISSESYNQTSIDFVRLPICGHKFEKAAIIDYFIKKDWRQDRLQGDCPMCRQTFHLNQVPDFSLPPSERYKDE